MQNVRLSRLGQAALAAALLFLLVPPPAAAFDLFARHRVDVQFASRDGKPLAHAEVRVFAPGHPDRPVLTGRTDAAGKFAFPADTDGMWSAEARTAGEIARVTIRVGGNDDKPHKLSPYWVVGGLGVLLVLAVAFRIARRRSRRPPG